MGDRSGSDKRNEAGITTEVKRRTRFSPAVTGRLCLVKDMNCASASLEAAQDVFGLRDDLLLKAVTGLEGGVVAGGSTCGVVTGGALGLAQLWREKTGSPPGASPVFMGLIGDYVRWFDGAIGTTLCRRRTGVDFHTTAGLIRYFLPGNRVVRCLSHIGDAIAYLEKAGADMADRAGRERGNLKPAPPHCASAVLEAVRKRTGLGDRRIEEIAAALSGGVGFSGGVCGALTGAVMGVNLLVGMDVRRYGRAKIIRDFAVGHINLLIEDPRWMPEPFGIGREFLRRFSGRAGSRQCRDIVGRGFADLADFSDHISSSRTCRGLIEFSSEMASAAVERWR